MTDRFDGTSDVARGLWTSVRFEDTRLLIRHRHAEVGEELQSRLTPFWDVRVAAADDTRPLNGEVRFEIWVDIGMVSPPKVKPVSYVIRGGGGLPRYERLGDLYDDGRTIVARDRRSGTWFKSTRGARVISVIGNNVDDCAKDCRRLVQDLVRLDAWRQEVAIIEAAALALPDGRTIVLAGPSGSGKTTTLTRLLRSSGGAFIANEEVFLLRSYTATVAIGAPVHVMIRRWLADRLPDFGDIAERMRTTGEEEVSMHYLNFADHLGSKVCRRGVVSTVLFMTTGSELRRLSEEEASERLVASFLWTDRWATPWRQLYPPMQSTSVRKLATIFASNLSSFEVGHLLETDQILELVSDTGYG